MSWGVGKLGVPIKQKRKSTMFDFIYFLASDKIIKNNPMNISAIINMSRIIIQAKTRHREREITAVLIGRKRTYWTIQSTFQQAGFFQISFSFKYKADTSIHSILMTTSAFEPYRTTTGWPPHIPQWRNHVLFLYLLVPSEGVMPNADQAKYRGH